MTFWLSLRQKLNLKVLVDDWDCCHGRVGIIITR